MPELQRVAIIGGTRIPFCRSNTAYADLSNLDMLADTLQNLVDRYGLVGKKIDEVIAGAVTTHSRDWNLAREAVLSTTLSPSTPGTTLQMACGTSLQAAMLCAGRIASGQIDCAIAAGSDTTSDAPLVFQRRFSQRLGHPSVRDAVVDALRLGYSVRNSNAQRNALAHGHTPALPVVDPLGQRNLEPLHNGERVGHEDCNGDEHRFH